MSYSFKVLDEDIVIQEDVVQYYRLLTSMEKRSSVAVGEAKTLFSSYKEPATVVEVLKGHLVAYINAIINDLSEHAILDKTVNDYLSWNQGYIKLMDAASNYYSITTEVTEKHTRIARASLETSKTALDRSVHGLDFGIITNSLIDYAVYASMNKKEIQRQSNEATTRFLQACQLIDAQKKRNIAEETKRYYEDVFEPEITEALQEAFGSILSLYIRNLDRCNAISAAVIEKIDFQRSNEVVANLETVSNKKGVFLQAITLCPFNRNVYYQGYKTYLSKEGIRLDDACGELLDFFDLRKQLTAVLIPKTDLIQKAGFALEQEKYPEAIEQFKEITSIYPSDYRGWLGLLLCTTRRFCEAEPDQSAINELYKKIQRNITSKELEIIEPEYETYIEKVTNYKRLMGEGKLLSASVTARRVEIESLQKKETQWLVLGFFFAIMSVLLLVGIIATGNAAYLITLTLLGIAPAAVLFWLYADAKKSIDNYQIMVDSEEQKKADTVELKKSFEKDTKLITLLSV